MTWNHESYRQLQRRICRDSFWQFLLHGYGTMYNPKGKRWLDPSIHKPLADWFESHIKPWIEARKHGKGYPLHLMVIVPRDVGKTTTITQAGLTWMHLLDPDISTYIGSERTEFAVDMLLPLQNVLTGEDTHARFAWLYGNWYDPKRVWKQHQLVHGARVNLSRKEPSFGIWGVESGITGKHPDVLCLDDPISYEKMAAASTWLQTVNNHVDSLIPVLPSDGCEIFVGTRYHDGDHLGNGMRKEGVLSISGMDIPGLKLDPEGKWHVYFLAGRDNEGVPTIPSVWSEQRLKLYERKNPLRYAAQVLNDPMRSDFNPVTRETIDKYMVDAKDVPKNIAITFHLDCAFKTIAQQAKGDLSVFTAMGHARDGSGNVYHLGSWGDDRWTGEKFGNELILKVQYYKAKGKKIIMITDESQIGGKSGTWELLLKSWFHAAGIVMPPLVLLPRTKKKEQRHIEAANFITDGHVFFVREAVGSDILIDQLLKIGGSLNDDYIDTFSDCFNDRCYRVMHRATDEPVDPSTDPRTDKLQDYMRGKCSFDEYVEAELMDGLDLGPYPPI